MTGPIAAQHRRPGFTAYAGWFLAAAFFFYAWILRVSPSVMVEQLMRDFAVSGAVLGNLSAFYFYAYAGLQMPVGLALDRWGPRRVLSIAVLGAGAGCLIFAAAPSVEVAYLGRTLIGAGAAFGLVGSMVLAGAWFPPRRFALLSGSAMALGLTGGIVGQGPMAVLVEGAGWRASIAYLGIGALVLAVLTWAFTRDRPTAGAEVPAATADAYDDGVLRALWRVARRPQTVAIALYAGFASSPMLAFGALWGVPYTMTAYGIGRPAAGFATSFLLLGFVIGSPLWGWISDRIGLRKPPALLGTALAGAALTVALWVPGLSFDLYRALLFLTGFGVGAMVVCYALTREHNARGGTGAALGLVNMLAVAGGAVFQPVVGLLLDLGWDGVMAAGARVYSIEAYRAAFLTLPALFALAFVSTLLIRETRCRPVETAAASAAA